MNFKPKISSEFDELILLARNDVDLANAVRDLLESGLPFVRADVNNLFTSSTGDRVLTYHLPEQLKVLVAAARAKKVEAENVPAGG